MSQLRRDSATDAVVGCSLVVEKDDACCPFGKAVGSAAAHLAVADNLCPSAHPGTCSHSVSAAAKFNLLPRCPMMGSMDKNLKKKEGSV